VHIKEVYGDVDVMVLLLYGSILLVTKVSVALYPLSIPVTNALELGTKVDWCHITLDPARLHHSSSIATVRTDLANRPTELMLVSYDSRYTKLWGNRGFLQSGSRQTTPVCVGVTCSSGISVVWVDRI